MPISTVIEVRLLQYAKVLPTIDVTEFGIVTEVNFVQEQNALVPIVVSPAGRIMFTSLAQFLNTEVLSLLHAIVSRPVVRDKSKVILSFAVAIFVASFTRVF